MRRSRFGQAAIQLEMLLFRRQQWALGDVEKLGAVEPDALRTEADGVLELLDQLDVRLQRDAVIVLGHRRLRAIFQQPPLGLFVAKDAALILGDHRLRRVDDQRSFVAVDNHHLVVVDHLRQPRNADDGGHEERLGDDRSVRCPPARFGGKADHRTTVEVNRVGGCQIVGQDDHVMRDLRKLVVGDPLQIRLHAVGDVLDIGHALAKVFIVEALEARLELLLHLGQRPFRVYLLRLDLLDDLVGERGISNDHGMSLEDGRVLIAHRTAHFLFQLQELLTGFLQRLEKPIDFGRHILLANGNPEDGCLPPFDDHRPANGDPGRDAEPLVGTDVLPGGDGGACGTVGEHGVRGREPRTHSTSSNFASMSFWMSSRAACSSSPFARTVIMAPRPAASSRMPRMLLPSTSSSPLRILISDLYRAAQWTSFAAARA